MTPIEIYGHGQEFGQISRNNQQLFTMQDLGGESDAGYMKLRVCNPDKAPAWFSSNPIRHS